MEFDPSRSYSQLRCHLISACEKLLRQLEPLALPEQRDELQQCMHALHNQQLNPILLAEHIQNVVTDVLYILTQRRFVRPVAPIYIDRVLLRKRYLEPYLLLEQLKELRLTSASRMIQARQAVKQLLETMLACFSFEMSTSVEQWSQWYDREQMYFSDLPHTCRQQEDEGVQFLYSLTLWFADCFQQQFHCWLTNILQPLMQTKMSAMVHTLEQPHQQFFAVLAHLHILMDDGDDGDVPWQEHSDEAWKVDEWQMVMKKIEQEKVSEIIACIEREAGNAWCDMLSSAYLFTENVAARGQQVEFDERLLKAMLTRNYQHIIRAMYQQWTCYGVSLVDAGLDDLQKMMDNHLRMCAYSIETIIIEELDAWQMQDTTGCKPVKIDTEAAIEQLQALYDEVGIGLAGQE